MSVTENETLTAKEAEVEIATITAEETHVTALATDPVTACLVIIRLPTGIGALQTGTEALLIGTGEGTLTAAGMTAIARETAPDHATAPALHVATTANVTATVAEATVAVGVETAGTGIEVTESTVPTEQVTEVTVEGTATMHATRAVTARMPGGMATKPLASVLGVGTDVNPDPPGTAPSTACC